MTGTMPGTELILPDGTTLAVRDRRAVGVERSGATHVEHRDPRGATMRTGWTSPHLPQVQEWGAEQAFRLGYAANVIAYRCVQLRARAGAAVPFVAGRKMGDAATISDTARLARLLGPPPGGPAPRLSANKLLRWTLAQQIVTGRRAWEIETDDRDVPVAFWPLVAAKLEAVPSKGGSEWFRLFEYGPRHDPVKFRPDQVFYGWEPAGNDFRQAESQLQAARFDLSLVTLCDRYSLGFLANNAVPAAIVTTTAFPNEAARRKFLQNWTSEYGGPDNAGRVALNEVGDDGDGPVGDSIDVKVLGLSHKDSRLIEQRREVVRELAVALGTPWSKLDASGRTYDNAEVEDRDWWENTILPDLLDLQDDINMQLAPRLGGEVGWFDLRQVRALARRIRPITQQVGVPALLFARVMKINEGRADYGLDPIEDGDRFLTDAEVNLLQGWGVAGQADAATMREALATLEARTAAIEGRSNETPGSVASSAGDDTNVVPETREQDPEVVEQRRARIWQASNAVVTGLEARWQRSWQRMFTRQEQAALDRLTGKRGRQALGYGTDGLPLEQRADPAPQIDAESIWTRTHWLEEQQTLAADLFEETTAAGLARLSMSFGVGFAEASPWAQEFIASRANQLAGQVADTTYEQIQAALNEGVRLGESIDDIAARVRGVFAEASTNRATVIARTEVISAYNGSAVLGASTLPADVVAAQEWIATRDARTRSAHAAVDGQVVPIGTAFDVGGDSLAYPGDPAGRARNTVQCRCTVAFLTPEEAAEAGVGRSPMVERRTAAAALDAVSDGAFDEAGFRRALEAAA